MTPTSRNDLAGGILGLGLGCFAVHYWLFKHYSSIRPHEPNEELGLVYPLNNHGSFA